MLKITAAVLGLGIFMAGTASAVSITGFGDPLTDPLLVAGVQENFDGVTPGEYATLTAGTISLTGVDGTFTVGADYNGSYNTTGGRSAYNNFDYAPTVFRIDFASVVKAFAFNFGASDEDWLLQAFDATGSLIDSLLIEPLLGSNAGEYFGLASASPIAYAMLSEVMQDGNESGGDFVFIDRLTTAGDDVPLPAALPLLASGIAGIAAMRRRRKTAA